MKKKAQPSNTNSGNIYNVNEIHENETLKISDVTSSIAETSTSFWNFNNLLSYLIAKNSELGGGGLGNNNFNFFNYKIKKEQDQPNFNFEDKNFDKESLEFVNINIKEEIRNDCELLLLKEEVKLNIKEELLKIKMDILPASDKTAFYRELNRKLSIHNYEIEKEKFIKKIN